MTNISSETLFHFTSNKDKFLSIIQNGFWPAYCPENLEQFNAPEHYAFPMTCFCDIPLSQIHNHVENYGKYAVGLTKKWGMQHGITPVLYIHLNSSTYTHITQVSQQIYNIVKDNDNKENRDLGDSIANLLIYFKPYEGYRWNKEKQAFENDITPTKFYNEREWRYIPTIRKEDQLFSLIPLDVYKQNKEIFNKKLENKKLTFTPNDIEHIIVSKDDEIPYIVNDIERIMKDKYKINDENTIKLLITKINSMERIRKDY